MVAELLATRYSRTLVLELDSPFTVEVFQRSDLARPGGIDPGVPGAVSR
jgi:hypothetical protein